MRFFFEHGLPHFAFVLPDGASEFIFMQIYLLYTGLVSLMTFIVYGADKARSKQTDPRRRKRRIPERVLLILAFAGGAWGAAAGMLVFHHKTRKRRFGVLVPLAVMLWVVGFLASVFLLGELYVF